MHSFSASFWATSTFFVLTSAAVHNDCTGTVLVQTTADGAQQDIWVGIEASFGGKLPSKPLKQQHLVVAEPSDGCIVPAELYSGKAALVERGGCSFFEKAENLQQADAASIVIYNNEPGCTGIAAGNISHSVLAAINASVVSVSQAAGGVLVAAALRGESVLLWAPTISRLDPSAGVIWLMAVCTVAAAAVWAGHDFVEGQKGAAHSTSQQVQSVAAVEVQMITGAGAVAFVACASAMLVFLFWFFNHVFVVILVGLFSIAAFQAIAVACAAIISAALPHTPARASDIPGLGRVSLPGLVALAPAGAWLTAWLLLRRSSWGWVFQDSMGIALIILILRQFLLPNAKVACILLPLCFFYDVFFVFLQPMITHGPSVMVEVATGGAAHESMPMLLQVPGFWGPPYGSTILGFGDVVLPGQLIVFARIVDLAWQLPLKMSYFLPLLGGYGAGLLLTFAALVLEIGGDQGQPALLYLVPCTLGLLMTLAWWRGDLSAMWQGIDRHSCTPALLDRRGSDIDEEHVPLARSNGDGDLAAGHDMESSGRK